MNNILVLSLFLVSLQTAYANNLLLSNGTVAFGTTKCGESYYIPRFRENNRIIAGTEAEPNSWPWAVIFEYHLDDKIKLCGSNLIRVSDTKDESDILITAAHCVMEEASPPVRLYLDRMHFRAGAHDRYQKDSIKEQAADAVDFRVHPDFTFQPLNNDIAVVKLSKSIKFGKYAKPICLPDMDADIPTNLTCVAVGWGRNETNATANLHPNTLQQLVLPVHSDQDCRGGWGAQYKIRTQICAGDMSENATSSMCLGDSGGPLACRETGSEDPWVLYGTTSFVWTDKCLNPSSPSVFARVSAFVDFIEEAAKNMTSVH